MKTIEIQLFKFNELSEGAQQNAIENNYDINVDYQWWDFVYDDAKNVGVDINSFDIDRGSIKGKIIDPEVTACDIIKEHGPDCDTHIAALKYREDVAVLIAGWPKDADNEYLNEDDLDAAIDDLNEDFEHEIFECYLQQLRREFEYLSSREAVKDTLIANDYDFTEDGKIY